MVEVASTRIDAPWIIGFDGSEHRLIRDGSLVYEDDTILAVFRDLDLDFVLQVVITLYALLLTHDAVSGERERGANIGRLVSGLSGGCARRHPSEL